MALSGFGMVLATFGMLPPVAGAVFQEAIDVAVILNALRAFRRVATCPATDSGLGSDAGVPVRDSRQVPAPAGR